MWVSGWVGWETWGIGNSCGYTLHAEILKTPLKVNPKGEIISNIQTSSCWYSPKEGNSREINFSFLPGGSYANSRILVTTNKHSCLVSYVSHGKQRIWKKEKREKKVDIFRDCFPTKPSDEENQCADRVVKSTANCNVDYQKKSGCICTSRSCAQLKANN